MSLKTQARTDRQRAYQVALRDLARFTEMQRQTAEQEAAAMVEGF